MVDAPATDDNDELLEEDEAFEEHHERVEKIDENAPQLKRAWRDTLEDMEAIAEEHRENGLEVLDIAAVDAGPIGRDSSDDEGEFGMEFVIADNDAEEFADAFEAGDYTQYDIYRGEVEGRAFIVEELVDPDAERVILLAGAYPLKDIAMCAYAAREEGEMYTFVRTLDGTRYGAFHHDGYEKFFPRAEELPEDPVELEFF